MARFLIAEAGKLSMMVALWVFVWAVIADKGSAAVFRASLVIALTLTALAITCSAAWTIIDAISRRR